MCTQAFAVLTLFFHSLMTIFFPQPSQLLTVFLWSGCCGVQNPVWPPCFVLPHCNTFTDVEDVKFVINYDYPNSSEDYIHRIGRTARSQKTGTAYTFFTPNNMKQASDLISVLREANQAINPKLIQMAEDRGGKNCLHWKHILKRLHVFIPCLWTVRQVWAAEFF